MKKFRLLLTTLLCFLSFILGVNVVNAEELCEKSDKYIAYEKLSDDEKKSAIEPEYCKKSESTKKTLKASVSSSRYSAKEAKLDLVAPENQGSLGTCWAFSAMSAVEINSVKNGVANNNYSEAHLLYGIIGGGFSDSAGKFNRYNTDDLNGGTLNFAPTYFFNNGGMLLEKEYAYPKSFKQITNNSYPKGRKYLTVSTFERFSKNNYGSCTYQDISTIKDFIIKYGSVQGTMYMDSSLFKDSAKDYYMATTSDAGYANHGITIIGWDDNISKTKFRNASRNGAWIIKNSWGSTWSKDGYFYISYDDNFICTDLAMYSGVTSKTFNNTYKTASLVGGTTINNKASKVSVASIITKSSSTAERVKRASFAVGDNQSYRVYLSKSKNKESNKDWILLGSGYSTYEGIKSVDITDTILVNSDYMIIVEYTSSSGEVLLPFMCNSNYYTRNATYTANKNYKKNGDGAWEDLYNISIKTNSYSYKNTCAPNIYVYTNNEVEAQSVSLNKTTVELEVGETDNLIATINPSNATDKTVSWESSNNSVVKVENGKVTALAVGEATVTAKTIYGKKITCKVKVIAPTFKVRYTTHVQYIGWQEYVKNGAMAGTSGKSLRLEGIKIKIENAPYAGDIEYRTHIQNIGWESSFKKNDEMSGTSGRSLRLEAIEIRLTGELAEHYDVYYRVHAQAFGWLGWAKSGERAGTAGYAYRLEGIEIKLLPKENTLPEYGKVTAFHDKNKTVQVTTTVKPVVEVKDEKTGLVNYTTHVQYVGWQKYVSDGAMAGTSGKSLRLEGIKISLNNTEYQGDIEYRTHIQNIGWESSFKKNDEMSGTSGRSLRLEAIEIKLTGEIAEHYDIYYRVHAQNFGWLGWAKNGEQAGTAGYAYRLEGIEIKLVKKGETISESNIKPYYEK